MEGALLKSLLPKSRKSARVYKVVNTIFYALRYEVKISLSSSEFAS